MGDHQVIIREVTPIELVDPAAVESESHRAAPRLQTAGNDTSSVPEKLVFIGATVYRFPTHPESTCSRVRVWAADGTRSYECWSNFDWNLLGGFARYVGSNGQSYSLLLNCTTTDVETESAAAAQRGKQYQMPEAPEFPAGGASFVIAQGTPTPEELAPLQALHDVYNSDKVRLKQAFEGREQAFRPRPGATPPTPSPPHDTVIHYWRIPKPAPAVQKTPAQEGGQ